MAGSRFLDQKYAKKDALRKPRAFIVKIMASQIIIIKRPVARNMATRPHAAACFRGRAAVFLITDDGKLQANLNNNQEKVVAWEFSGGEAIETERDRATTRIMPLQTAKTVRVKCCAGSKTLSGPMRDGKRRIRRRMQIETRVWSV